jgi:hypothetical protein
MKNSQKGFIVPILIIIIAALVVGGGTYIYQKNKQIVPTKIEDTNTKYPVNATATTTVAATSSQKSSINNKVVHSIQLLPKDGQLFTFGNTLIIQWDPSVINVSTMYLKNIHPVAGKSSGLQIYHRVSLSDGVSASGIYKYKIPIDYTIDPGEYQVELDSYGESQKVLLPNKFLIQVPSGVSTKSKNNYYINSIKEYPAGVNNLFISGKTYKSSDSISVAVDGREGDGTVASSEKGFNIQAHIMYLNGAGISATNATFDTQSNLWNINLQVPLISGQYTFEIGLYCGHIGLNSLCSQKYSNSSEAKSTFTFTVAN